MIESKVTPFSRSHYVSVTASHHMTVAEVLAFADALRESEIPEDVQVGYNTAYSTGHFIGLTARYTETADE